MAQTQNYEVYYDIKVNATEGTEQVTAFANAVEKLSKGRISFAPVVTNINEMMQAVEKTFRGKNGKKKDFNFDLEIRTGETECRFGCQERHGHPADGHPFHRQDQLCPRSFREKA